MSKLGRKDVISWPYDRIKFVSGKTLWALSQGEVWRDQASYCFPTFPLLYGWSTYFGVFRVWRREWSCTYYLSWQLLFFWETSINLYVIFYSLLCSVPCNFKLREKSGKKEEIFFCQEASFMLYSYKGRKTIQLNQGFLKLSLLTSHSSQWHLGSFPGSGRVYMSACARKARECRKNTWEYLWDSLCDPRCLWICGQMSAETLETDSFWFGRTKSLTWGVCHDYALLTKLTAMARGVLQQEPLGKSRGHNQQSKPTP